MIEASTKKITANVFYYNSYVSHRAKSDYSSIHLTLRKKEVIQFGASTEK